MFFQTWSGLGRVLVVGICAYAGLVLMLRISGKRTLSKMNAFDFVVTVALGSTLASLLLSKEVPLAEGFLALALLILLQWVVAWMAVRFSGWRKLIKSEPRLLALRKAGKASLADAEAVVLETDGSVSIIAADFEQRTASALHRVRGFRPAE